MIAVSTGREIRGVLKDLKGRIPVHLTRGKRVAKLWAVDQDTAKGAKQWAFSLSVDGDPSTDHLYHTAFSFYKGLEAALLGREIEIGATFNEHINQNDRFCEVVDRKRTRFRIEYEMPNAGMMQAWRNPFLIRGDVWYYIPVRIGTYHAV